MTYPPLSVENTIMPTQTRCERVPPHGTRFDKCLDLTSIGHDELPLEVTHLSSPFSAATDLPPVLLNMDTMWTLLLVSLTTPQDPRTWGREEVGSWVARSGGLPERFPMNGKALCLMSKEMFSSRVPNFGHLLYQDFRKRLARALALQELAERLSNRK